MKIALKPITLAPKKPGEESLPTSVDLKSMPNLKVPKVETPGAKFRYKGAREK